MSIAYTIHVREPHARRVEVSVAAAALGAASLDVRMPVWTPGSYLVREHQRHVDGLAAADELGRPLPVEKVDKQTWRVRCPGAREVRVTYRLHCFELTVRTNHVDGTHAFLNPAATCLLVVGREHEPCAVRLALPPGWAAWVALPESGGSFLAGDYDELVDSPFELGPASSHVAADFTAAGARHRIVIWGKGDFDLRRLVADLGRIVEAQAALFGGLPFSGAASRPPSRASSEPYLFILHLNDKGRGGLEHRRSCALLAPRFSFVGKGAYEDFLALAAHEYFHLWNVKRLRPAAFTPYDWTGENHTGLLWAMEGLTSTFELLVLLRAGLLAPERFLALWAERLTQLQRTPGRLRTSLVQASYDAWIKQYRPDETSANTTVSYYLKGCVVGLLLDLELRRRSGGARSLDDLVRLAFQRHGAPPGLPEDGVEQAALALVPPQEQPALAAWFDRAIRSTAELDYGASLAAVGLRAVLHGARSGDDKGGVESDPAEAPSPGPSARAWLGATLRERGSSQEVTQVAEGGPAQLAGLSVGDELVALDGFRSDLAKRLGRALPGQAVRLTFFRLDELLDLPVVLAAAPPDTVTIVPDPAATPAQLAARERWLGCRWPEEAAGEAPEADAERS